jgi:hypothetical protein
MWPIWDQAGMLLRLEVMIGCHPDETPRGSEHRLECLSEHLGVCAA